MCDCDANPASPSGQQKLLLQELWGWHKQPRLRASTQFTCQMGAQAQLPTPELAPHLGDAESSETI